MNTQNLSKRMPWIDVLKGIGIILVVIGHVYSGTTIYNWLYSFHMPLFFLAAGLVYKEKPILIDLKRRIQAVIVPYFSFGLFVLIYWYLVERRFRTSETGFIDSLLGLLSGQYSKLDFNVHLWFLPCFFITVVLFNVFVNLGNLITGIIAASLMSIIYIFVPLVDMPWGFDRVFKYIGFYAVGVLLANCKYIVEASRHIYKNIAFGIMMILMNFVLAYFNQTSGEMWFVTAFIGTFGVLFLSLAIDKNRLLQYWGRISLVILCIHGPIYRIIVKIISIPLHISTEAVRESFLLSIIVVVVSITICSFIYEVVVRVAPWMIGKNGIKSINITDYNSDKKNWN